MLGYVLEEHEYKCKLDFYESFKDYLGLLEEKKVK